MLKQALPKDLNISIEKLAKQQLEQMTAEVRELIDKQILEPIKANSELVGALAKAIVSIRSIPENLRQEIAVLTKEPTVINTPDSIKLELNTELAEEKKESKKVYLT